MGKNDFDINFDFEDENVFDPKAFLGSEEYDDNIDLSEFSDEELGLTSPPENTDGEDSVLPEDTSDFDDMDLDEFLRMDGEDDDYQEDSEEDFSEEGEYLPEEPDLSEDLDPDEERNENMAYSEDQEAFEDEENSPEGVDDVRKRSSRQKSRPSKERKAPKVTLPKIAMPNIFGKFFDLYFAPVLNKEMRDGPVDPDNPRRRRRKSPSQIFKEVYLPPIIACLCLILVLSFAIGSVSNLIQQKRDEADIRKSQLDSSISAAQQAELENQRLLEEAEALAVGYDYNGAIGKLDTINNGDLTPYPDLQAKRSEYITAQAQLVEYNDYSLIPNLSFHVLIEDPVRAYADQEFGGLYNRNFVTTSEFRKILTQLYNNGYVLVDFDSFTGSNTDPSGNQLFDSIPIYLPADKKPVMITETMVNYFNYMIDGNDDKVADANGDGFASRLVLSNGEIKAEYINSSGETLIGDYDLVPILESFIQEHPDFSYQGARATLAVTGSEGIFGYRCISDYISIKSQEFVDQEIAGAKQIVQALRDKGYTLACFTYSNATYGTWSVQQINADLQSWKQKITPVIGDVNVFIFAKTSNITDFSGQAFNAMYSEGFRYFVGHGDKPYAEITTSYVRQNRLMVTGETMAWYSNYFNNIFDCAAVLDISIRGSVPKG